MALSTDGKRGVVDALVRLRPRRSSTSARPAQGRRPGRGRPRAAGGRDLGRRQDGLRRRRGEQRGRPGRPRRAARSPAGSPVGREPRGSRSRPTARGCSSATPGRRTSRSIATGPWTVERTIADRRRQPPAGRHQPPTARPATSPTCRTAGSPRRANNIDLGWVLGQRLTRVALDGSEPFATLSLDPQGKAAGRRPRRGRQPRRHAAWPSAAAARTR